MPEKTLETPVIFVVFNRPVQTKVAFSRIEQAKPAHLLVIADGPRMNKLGEAERCEEVRRIATAVNWPCKVEINFASENMGCRNRIVSGLSWAFERVEEAIILEDDIVPDPSFFPFCAEMLERYRCDYRVGMITGFNQVQNYVKRDESYFFSRLSHVWGWATWRRAWKDYDERLKDWPEMKRSGLLREIFDAPAVIRYWAGIFDSMHDGTGPNTWDYQWIYTNLIQNRLEIVPRVNLIENIGFGADATHTTSAEQSPEARAQSVSFPLVHPTNLIPMRSLDRRSLDISGCRVPTLPERAIRKLNRLARKSLVKQKD